MMDTNKIYLGDCMELFSLLPNESIDLAITDPPYKMNHTSGSTTSVGLKEKWGGNLKAGDKTANILNDIAFSDWLPEVYRVLAKQAHFYVFVNDKNMQEMLNEATKCGFYLHNILVWKKNNCTPNRFYMKNCEFVIFLRKGKSFTINDYSSSQFLEYENISGRNKLHPTQKPIPLLEKLITNSSSENSIVFDPFMGSGSLAVAALNTKRRFIGFEMDKQYYDVAQSRLQK